VTGAYIKIGFFRSESNLQFQDDIHGNLFEQVECTMELLLTKYTRAIVSYKGLSRIETYGRWNFRLGLCLLSPYSGHVPFW
jgi:ATP-dependent DNA helicase RecG